MRSRKQPTCATAAGVLVVPAHGATAPAPIPHWIVLLLAVPALWIAIGSLAVVVDRLLGWLGV